MALETVPLPQALLAFDPQWLDVYEADALMAILLAQTPWENHRIRLFGREYASPRMSCWIGDADASYRYSGTRFEPQPWLPALLPIRERLTSELGVEFNSVLANMYRDGRDAMGWHSDDERELGREPVIASVSLGATRRFVLKHRIEPERKLSLALGHGSLLVMSGATQWNYRHALSRTAKPVGVRINLTFRWVRPSAACYAAESDGHLILI